MTFAASCGGSAESRTLELVGVDENRAAEAIGVLQDVRECDRPIRVVLDTVDSYSIQCEKDGFIFDAVRSHTVFCADGMWQFVAWADYAGTGTSCTPS